MHLTTRRALARPATIVLAGAVLAGFTAGAASASQLGLAGQLGAVNELGSIGASSGLGIDQGQLGNSLNQLGSINASSGLGLDSTLGGQGTLAFVSGYVLSGAITLQSFAGGLTTPGLVRIRLSPATTQPPTPPHD